MFNVQVPGTVPLKLYWSAAHRDNTLIGLEGYVPDAVPYSLGGSYWNAARGDNLLAAQNSPLAINAGAGHYNFQKLDGAIWKFQYPTMGPLDNYWNSARADNFVVGGPVSQSRRGGRGSAIRLPTTR